MLKTLRPAFPPEAQRQYEAFLAEYAGLQAAAKMAHPTIVKPRSDAIVQKLVAIAPAERWWTDLAQLELCINDYLLDEAVRARVVGWRRRFREVAGEARFATYLVAAPVAASAPIEDVRADLGECMRGVYYLYAGYGVAATSRNALIKDLLKYGALIVFVEVVAALLLGGYRPVAGTWWPSISDSTRSLLILATWTSIVAVVGSVVSVQRRLEDPKIDADPYFRYIQTSADRLSVSLSSPFFGAVFGYIIFALVSSKLILGSAIPDVTNPSIVSTSFILILGFISGFAEQLVPDALTRVAARALGSVSDGGSTSLVSGGGASRGYGGSAPNGATNGTTGDQSLILLASDENPKVGADTTITVSARGITGPISAATTDTNVLRIGAVSGSAPGMASFDATALQTGTGTITVSAGSKTASLDVHVS